MSWKSNQKKPQFPLKTSPITHPFELRVFRAAHVIAATIPNIMANGTLWLRTNLMFSLPRPTAYG
jgi:hypothetical protein